MAKAPGPMGTVVRGHGYQRRIDVNRLRNNLDDLLHILHCRFVVIILIFPIVPSSSRPLFFLWHPSKGKRTQGLSHHPLSSVW